VTAGMIAANVDVDASTMVAKSGSAAAASHRR
jgi:hypothetical protein